MFNLHHDRLRFAYFDEAMRLCLAFYTILLYVSKGAADWLATNTLDNHDMTRHVALVMGRAIRPDYMTSRVYPRSLKFHAFRNGAQYSNLSLYHSVVMH